jgi:hypothetical protein
MDHAGPLDIEAVRAAVRHHDYLIFRFATVPTRLFVDFRDGPSGPGVVMLGPAASARERLSAIAAARPGLPRPRRLHVVTWPLRVGGLDRLGVVEEVRVRFAILNGFQALRALQRALAELERAERREVRRAISGQGYRTLWAAGAR